MSIFPSFNLIGQGETVDWAATLPEGHAYEVLILHEGDRAFLEKVFAAAGYQEPEQQLYFLEWDAQVSLHLATLVAALGVKKIVLFNQDLPGLGLHFRVAPYFPVTVGGRTYLVAESDTSIAAAKAAGNNAPAGKLWRALQGGFLRE